MSLFAELQDPLVNVALDAVAAALDGRLAAVLPGTAASRRLPTAQARHAQQLADDPVPSAAKRENTAASRLAYAAGYAWTPANVRTCIDDLVRCGPALVSVEAFDRANPVCVRDGQLRNVTFERVSELTFSLLEQTPVYYAPVATSHVDGAQMVTGPFSMLHNTRYQWSEDGATFVPQRGYTHVDMDSGDFVNAKPCVAIASMDNVARFLEVYEHLRGGCNVADDGSLLGLGFYNVEIVAPHLAKALRDVFRATTVPRVQSALTQNECRLLVPDASTGSYSPEQRDVVSRALRLLFAPDDTLAQQQPVANFVLTLWRELADAYTCTIGSGDSDGNVDATVQRAIVSAYAMARAAKERCILAHERLDIIKMSEMMRDTIQRVFDETKRALDNVFMFRGVRLPVLNEIARGMLFSLSGLALGNTYNFMIGVAPAYNTMRNSEQAPSRGGGADAYSLTRRCYRDTGKTAYRRQCLLAYGATLPALRTKGTTATDGGGDCHFASLIPAAVGSHSFSDGDPNVVLWPSIVPDERAGHALSQLFWDMHTVMVRGVNPGGSVKYRRVVALLWTALNYSMLHARYLWDRQLAGMPSTPRQFQPGTGPSEMAAKLVGAPAVLAHTPSEAPFSFLPVEIDQGVDLMAHLMGALDAAADNLSSYAYLIDVAPVAMQPAHTVTGPPRAVAPLVRAPTLSLTSSSSSLSSATSSSSLTLSSLLVDAAGPTLPASSDASAQTARELWRARTLDDIAHQTSNAATTPANLWMYMATPDQVLEHYNATQTAPSLTVHAVQVGSTTGASVKVEDIALWFRETIGENFELFKPNELYVHFDRRKNKWIHEPSGRGANLSMMDVVRIVVDCNNKYMTANPYIDFKPSNQHATVIGSCLAALVWQTLGIHMRAFVGDWIDDGDQVMRSSARRKAVHIGGSAPQAKRVASGRAQTTNEGDKRDDDDDDVNNKMTGTDADVPPPPPSGDAKLSKNNRPFSAAVRAEVLARMHMYCIRDGSALAQLLARFEGNQTSGAVTMGMRTNINAARIRLTVRHTTQIPVVSRQKWLDVQPRIAALIPDYVNIMGKPGEPEALDAADAMQTDTGSPLAENTGNEATARDEASDAPAQQDDALTLDAGFGVLDNIWQV